MRGYVGRHRRPEPHGYVGGYMSSPRLVTELLPPPGWGYTGASHPVDRALFDRDPEAWRRAYGDRPLPRPPHGPAGVSRAD